MWEIYIHKLQTSFFKRFSQVLVLLKVASSSEKRSHLMVL
uniref:Uncharacterized protein n=1 Tax=Rhizophora mucronata TaxID=61149 RepID=A0A2P2M1K7_RHIMU